MSGYLGKDPNSDYEQVMSSSRKYVDDNLGYAKEYTDSKATDIKEYTDNTVQSAESKLAERIDGIKFEQYDPETTYSYLDVVWVMVGDVKRYYEWYSNVESLAGKDPSDESNRRPGWSDTTKPFYWVPYSTRVSGETMTWDGEQLPESMIVGLGQQLPAAVYHTLATAKPEWIDATDNSLINIPDRQGRFVRAADGTNWVAGATHEDAIRNIEGNVYSISESYGCGGFGDGAFQKMEYTGTHTPGAIDNGSTGAISFNADRVVPTSSENQPKGYIEWVGYAL